jgi:hypothetical protein
MPMFETISDKLRWRPKRLKTDIFARFRLHCETEIEQDEERCLEAMHHWHSPVERSRTLHCRRHALVDDNPTSG